MGHPMFTYDPGMGETIFEYCRTRFHTLITSPQVVSTSSHPLVISIDSPRFLAFIPNAPTKASLLFDMVVSCSSLNGTSFLESAGIVVAENQLLSFFAERAGMAPREWLIM